jgi:hypothetical protein
MYEFELRIRLPNYTTQVVRIRADNAYSARLLAEAQYGSSNVMSCSQV